MSTDRRAFDPEESAKVDQIIARERERGCTLEAICAALAAEGLPLGRTAVHNRCQRLGAKPREGRAWKSTATPTGNPVNGGDPVVEDPPVARAIGPMTPAQVSALADALEPLAKEDDAYGALHALRERGRPLAPIVDAMGHALVMFASDVLKGDVEADKP